MNEAHPEADRPISYFTVDSLPTSAYVEERAVVIDRWNTVMPTNHLRLDIKSFTKGGHESVMVRRFINGKDEFYGTHVQPVTTAIIAIALRSTSAAVHAFEVRCSQHGEIS